MRGAAWLLLFACGCEGVEEARGVGGRADETVLVYNAVLRDMFVNGEPWPKVLVLDPETKPTAKLAELRRRVAEAHDDTVAAYERETRAGAMPKEIDVGAPIETFGEADWNERAGGAWPGFRRLFPEARDWVSLSNVGFSQDGRQALLHVRRAGGPLDAATYLVLLERQRDGWHVSKKVMTSIS